MKVNEWLDFFKNNSEKKLFSLSDLSQLTGINKPSLSVQLSRLTKKNIIKRASKDWYENPFNNPTNEEISMVIRYPSYISMEYLLSKKNILSQAVQTYTLITTKLPYTYQKKDKTFEYHQIGKNLFFGYVKENKITLAEPEKALLDIIYIRYLKNNEFSFNSIKSLIDDMAIEEINLKKLDRYSNIFGRKMNETINKLGLLI